MNEWEELDVNEVLMLINNNVPNPSPELRDQLYGLITETQYLVIEINEVPRQTELEQAVLAERKAVLEAVEALTGMEADRHKMFSEGYDHALYHIRQLVEGRSKK